MAGQLPSPIEPEPDFKPYVPSVPVAGRVHAQGDRPRRPVRPPLRRRHGLPRAQGRPHRQRVDPDRGALDLACFKQARAARRSSRTTSCRRSARRASRSPPASSSPSRRCSSSPTATLLRLLADPMLAARRRHPRHPDDGPAAARAHRQGARATLPYPEGTACADVLIVGEQGGNLAKTRLRRRRHRRRLQAVHAVLKPVEGRARRCRPARPRSIPTPRSTPRSRPSSSASATSSARASPPRCSPAACSPGSCSSR